MSRSRRSAIPPVRSRRSALRAIGGAGALVAGALSTAHWRRAFAQATKSIRIWSSQIQPPQLVAWDAIIKAFEVAHPGLKIELTKTSASDLLPKLSAAFVSGEQPEIVTGGAGVMPAALHRRGLAEDLSDVVKAVGDISPRLIQNYNDGGYQFSLSQGLTVTSTMWVRNDLLAAAGLKAPKHWDELVAVAKALTKDGRFGATLPYGKALHGAQVVDMFTRQAGGDVIAPDGTVVYNSPAAIRALEFLKEMRPYCPTGANNYGFAETLNAFVVGQAAIGIYTGRVLVNVATQNPGIDDKIAAGFYPYPRDGIGWWYCGFDPLWVPKGGKVRTDEAKAFLRFFFKPEMYLQWVHSAPGHQLPVTRSVAELPAFHAHPMLAKHRADVETMLAIAEKAGTDIRPTSKHPLQVEQGPIQNSYILAEAMQKVVIDNASPKEAVAWAHDQIGKIVKG